jgi:hypothetical protein
LLINSGERTIYPAFGVASIFLHWMLAGFGLQTLSELFVPHPKKFDLAVPSWSRTESLESDVFSLFIFLSIRILKIGVF